MRLSANARVATPFEEQLSTDLEPCSLPGPVQAQHARLSPCLLKGSVNLNFCFSLWLERR